MRGAAFGFSALLVFFVGIFSVAYAQNPENVGGKFGEILNKILVKPWNDPQNDGTVKNATMLGGKPASSFVKAPINVKCEDSCVSGFTQEGKVLCSDKKLAVPAH